MEEIKNTIPCDTCEYCGTEGVCNCPADIEKPCKEGFDGANLGLGTLYDLNKNILLKSSVLSEKQTKDLISNLALSLGDRYQYYMLLNNETRDYTLFNFCSKATTCIEFREDLYECLFNRGDVLAVDKKSENTYEIWLRVDNEVLCYYFFPYDLGVLEY
jgi:hypothetical protein